MKVLIADDEPLARSLLRNLLEDAGDIEVIGEAAGGDEAIALACALNPDAVFLDIDMPGSHGVSAAHALRGRSAAEIVFVTAHEPHAVDAFELGAADYVLKPVRRPRLATAIERVRERLRARATREPGGRDEPVFWVPDLRGSVRLSLSDIVWIEAARDHVYFHTAARSYLHRITMEQLEARLSGTHMIRVRRSAFVARDKVAGILRRGKSVLLRLEGGAEVPVGPTYRARVLASLTGES